MQKKKNTGIFAKIRISIVKMFSNTTIKKTNLVWFRLQADLQHALENKELLIQYQPIIDLRSGKIFGMEALLRWQHPHFGIISPDDLIPLAEATGLMATIGEWVLQEACTQTVQWHKEKFSSNTLKLFINLKLSHLRKANFLETLDYLIEKTKMDPRLLNLELSQTAFLEKKDIPTLKAIAQRGLSLSLDDFGTANSKWDFLKFFELIKIDNKFIQRLNSHENNSRMMVSSILAMATSLGLKTLAEGLETQEQYQFLKDARCDFIQGFYFSKPLSSEHFSQLLKNTP